MKNNTQLLAIAKKYLGKGGAIFRKYCGLPSNAPYCCAFVTYIFHKGDDSPLFYGGKKVVYCPSATKWCEAHLALVPPYLALPMDIIFFDWNDNGVPDHIGFVKERKSCDAVYTLEGNTSGGIVDTKLRNTRYVEGIYRPHYPAKFDISKPLEIDGLFGYNSIAMLQKTLGGLDIDGILGKSTVKKLQKWAGVPQDGAWGKKTSKAIQKKLKVKADGLCGPDTVKAFQKYLNKHAFAEKVNNEVNIPQPVKPAKKKDPLQPWFDAMVEQYKWSKDQNYKWVTPTVKSSKTNGTCITFHSVAMQRLGLIPSGTYFYFYPKTKKITGKAAELIKNSDKFKLWYPNKTVYELWRDGEIKIGDMVGYGNPHYHSMVFMGFNDKGEPIFNTMGGGRRGLKVTYPYYAKRKVNMIVRIKKIA